MSAILKAMGLSFRTGQTVPEDRSARDSRLVDTIAAQLPYGKTFTDTLNFVRSLKNIGQACCETDRAYQIFERMTSTSNYSGMRIDYDKVRVGLLNGWHRPGGSD